MAIKDFFGELAAEKMSTPDSSFYSAILRLHEDAAANGYTYTVDDVDIEKHDTVRFFYTATLAVSGVPEKVSAYGSLQFNDDGKIDFMSIRTKPPFTDIKPSRTENDR